MATSSPHQIVAIILAAGTSSRMGNPKLLLPWKDHTIIEETVDQVLGADYDDVVVVAGSERDEIAELLAEKPVRVALNLNFRAGMAGSIKAGVSFIDASATAFAIVLGDQPRIGSKIHKLVLAQFRKSKKGICVPTHEGQIGHPVIFSIDYRAKIFGLQGDNGARSLVAADPDQVAYLELKAPEILPSINTPKDFEEQKSLA